MLIYCPDTQKTQEICDKVVDGCLVGLKFIPDLFDTSTILIMIHS